MTNILITIFQVLIAVYWSGEMARQNKSINEFVSSLEKGYSQFNSRLKKVNVEDGLLNFFKICEVSIFAGILLSVISYFQFPSIKNISATIFTLGVLGAASFEWNVKRMRFSINYFIIIMLLTLIIQFLIFFHNFIPDPNLEYVGWTKVRVFTYTSAFLSGAGLFYVTFWLISSVIMYILVLLMYMPVIVAKAIHKIAPTRPLYGLTVVFFVGISLYQTFR